MASLRGQLWPLLLVSAQNGPLPMGAPRGSEDREGASDSVPVLRQGRGERWVGCGCSQPLVPSVPGREPHVSYGGFWKNFPVLRGRLVALFAPGNLVIAFTLVSVSPFWCLGVASGVRCIRDTCFAWFNSGHMFYERLLANFTYFLRVVHSDPWCSSTFRRMEKCAQLMLRVAVFLRAVRTWNTGHPSRASRD